MHKFEFNYILGSGHKSISGTWSIKENTVSDAKKKLKVLLERKYHGLPISELMLVHVDEKQAKRHVKLLGLPASYAEIARGGGGLWETALRESPDLLRLARFASSSPEHVNIEIQLKNLGFQSLRNNPYLKFYGSLYWNPTNDNLTIKDVTGDRMFRAELAEMPKWIEYFHALWETTLGGKKIVLYYKYNLKPGAVKAPEPKKSTPLESDLLPLPENWSDFDKEARDEWREMTEKERYTWLEENQMSESEYKTAEEQQEHWKYERRHQGIGR